MARQGLDERQTSQCQPVMWGRLKCRGGALKQRMLTALNNRTDGGKQYFVGVVVTHPAQYAVAVPRRTVGRSAAIGWLVEPVALP